MTCSRLSVHDRDRDRDRDRDHDRDRDRDRDCDCDRDRDRFYSPVCIFIINFFTTCLAEFLYSHSCTILFVRYGVVE